MNQKAVDHPYVIVRKIYTLPPENKLELAEYVKRKQKEHAACGRRLIAVHYGEEPLKHYCSVNGVDVRVGKVKVETNE